jgi:LEA14-like dessication related protein
MRSFARLLASGLAAVLCLSFSSCAGLGKAVERPRVRVLGVEVSHVSLESADLVFDLEVENHNRFSFVLETVDYRVRINEEPLLDGRQDLRAEIAAHGASEVELPVTLRFTDIVRVLRSLKGERHAGYDLDAVLGFSIPIVGRLSIPVRQKGDVSLDAFRIRL